MVAGKEAEAGEDQHEVPTAVEETTSVQPEKVYSTLLFLNQKVEKLKIPPEQQFNIIQTEKLIPKKKQLLLPQVKSQNINTQTQQNTQLVVEQTRISETKQNLIDRTKGANIHPILLEMLEPHNKNMIPYTKQGGAIKFHLAQWKVMTSDRYIIQMVQGLI